jgi:uncharacterized protein YbjQ (UPF0145 family)
MRNKILYVTTTSGIDGKQVEKYLGIVTSQAVQGVNIFSDVLAGFRDVFGGYSVSYQNKLKQMEDRVIDDLTQKAQRLGANAIIGLRLDFDEISGQGKGMLMLTAQGTAVRIAEVNENPGAEDVNKISYQHLDFEVHRHKLLKKIENGKQKVKDMEGVSALAFYGIGNFEIVANFVLSETVSLKQNSDSFEEFMAVVEMRQISDYLQRETFIELDSHGTKRIISLVEKVDWFDFEVIMYLLMHEQIIAHQKALLLLGFQKPEYTLADIPLIEQLIRQIEKTFSSYPMMIVKQGMFGKQKEMWQCVSCGKENEMEYEYCTDGNCGVNRYGMKDLSITPESIINDWKLKAELIKKLLE